MIGEELGFVGAVIVVILFATLGLFGIRTALPERSIHEAACRNFDGGCGCASFLQYGLRRGFRADDRRAVATDFSWRILGDRHLGDVGALANCARHEPEAISSMQHEGRPFIDRLLFLPEPVPHIAGDQRRTERRSTTHVYGEPVTRQRPVGGAMSQDFAKDRKELNN